MKTVNAKIYVGCALVRKRQQQQPQLIWLLSVSSQCVYFPSFCDCGIIYCDSCTHTKRTRHNRNSRNESEHAFSQFNPWKMGKISWWFAVLYPLWCLLFAKIVIGIARVFINKLPSTAIDISANRHSTNTDSAIRNLEHDSNAHKIADVSALLLCWVRINCS